MTRLKLTNYTPEGELLAPTQAILNSANVPLGGTPTTDPGWYHRFKFESSTKAETLDKARRFFALMDAVPLYSTLILKPYEVHIGGLHRWGYDIVYAVENPGIR